MSAFRINERTWDHIASVARAEVRRLRRPLSLADAERAVSEWAHAQHESRGVDMPSIGQMKSAVNIAANEAANYATLSARLGKWA